ncbi:DUF411 domain-containing protein [Luteimonas soli]|uniref:DUF411 domain-containing protein n=1 Tax=Luteimonas soli TaxID=1648966 RepID=A0ABV7XHD4_9GAMM
MSIRNLLMTLGVLAGATTMMACARSPEATSPMVESASPSTQAIAEKAQAWPAMIVHKSPRCGCCELWVTHLRDAGFAVEVRNEDNLNPIKEHVGVPYGKGSCHTAEVAGYFVEGHVPAQDIQRLLTQRPDAKGLVLPGMPAGSPGMEMPDGTQQAYTVELVQRDGTTVPFAQHL